jgi:hypothetical protein
MLPGINVTMLFYLACADLAAPLGNFQFYWCGNAENPRSSDFHSPNCGNWPLEVSGDSRYCRLCAITVMRWQASIVGPPCSQPW